MTALAAVLDHVEHFQARVCREAIADAEAATWERRAALLEWAIPRPGEFHGRATRQELSDRATRLRAEAQACRNRARVSVSGGDL